MNPVTYFLLTLFGGFFGLHKFVSGKKGMGILYLCTFGLFGIGWIIDIIRAAQAIATIKRNIPTSFTLPVAGTYYKQKEIASLAKINKDYNLPPNELAKKYQPDTKIYQYKYTRLPALLVPEPTNPHDKNAIMILINGKHVGYIPADDCADINTLLSKKSIIDITAKIYSGNYKCLKQIAPDMYDCSTICNELDVEISLNTK